MESNSGKYIDLEGLKSELEEHNQLLFLANKFTMTEAKVESYRLSLQPLSELFARLTHKQIELMKFWEIEEEKKLDAADKIKSLINISLITGGRLENIIAWRKEYMKEFEINFFKYREANSQIDKIQKQKNSISGRYGIAEDDIKSEKKVPSSNPALQALLNKMFIGDKKK